MNRDTYISKQAAVLILLSLVTCIGMYILGMHTGKKDMKNQMIAEYDLKNCTISAHWSVCGDELSPKDKQDIHNFVIEMGIDEQIIRNAERI